MITLIAIKAFFQKAWKWLRANWYIPLTVLGAIAGVVVGTEFQRRGSAKDASKRVRRELDAIDASSQIAEVVAEKGAERALEVIDAAHKKDMELLSEKNKAKVETLRGDPIALSKFLVRVGSRED